MAWTRKECAENLEAAIGRNIRLVENANQREQVLKMELERIQREITDLSKQGIMLRVLKDQLKE